MRGRPAPSRQEMWRCRAQLGEDLGTRGLSGCGVGGLYRWRGGDLRTRPRRFAREGVAARGRAAKSLHELRDTIGEVVEWGEKDGPDATR